MHAADCVRLNRHTTCGCGQKWIIELFTIKKYSPPQTPTSTPRHVTTMENKWNIMAFFEFLVRGAAVSVFHGSEWCGPGSLEFLAKRSEFVIYLDVLSVRCVHAQGNWSELKQKQKKNKKPQNTVTVRKCCRGINATSIWLAFQRCDTMHRCSGCKKSGAYTCRRNTLLIHSEEIPSQSLTHWEYTCTHKHTSFPCTMYI